MGLSWFNGPGFGVVLRDVHGDIESRNPGVDILRPPLVNQGILKRANAEDYRVKLQQLEASHAEARGILAEDGPGVLLEPS